MTVRAKTDNRMVFIGFFEGLFQLNGINRWTFVLKVFIFLNYIMLGKTKPYRFP